ncbi:MAG TPA: hypothetical protein VLS93_16925 [Anaeromyxobacteraceae bacterium]|nr:hypothetical protein [Anaeromyxobacteraceae bacterium]
MAELDVSEAVAWLEAVGLIRRTGEIAHGMPVFVPVLLSPEDRAEVYAKLARRLRQRGAGGPGDAGPQRPDLPPHRS